MSKEIPLHIGLAQKITDASDKVSIFAASLLAPHLRKKGVDLVVTKTREERIALLTQELVTIASEGGGIDRIEAALGGEDGDMDELAVALHKSELLEGAQAELVMIVRPPDGPAPEFARKSWIGV